MIRRVSNKNRVFIYFIIDTTIFKNSKNFKNVNTKNGLVLRGNKVRRSIKQMHKYAYRKELIIYSTVREL
jgi:hypothetical protein